MNELMEFSLDSNNALKNYNLAVWYEKRKHFAPAHTFYLRCAERSDNNSISYDALIRSAICYGKQGSRDTSQKVCLENALALCPDRPEAYYFLSLLYEKKQEWQSCYLYAHLGLLCKEYFNIKEYPGTYGLLFQKSVSAWWWGKGKESREILQILVDNYWDEMDEKHKILVERNITQLGSGPESEEFHTYTKDNHKQLRFNFKNSETIERNYSQVYQDIFVLSILDGKRNGTFLEIGAADPFKGNNTALLEKEFDWSGISIEFNDKFLDNFRNHRKSNLIHADALEIDYQHLLSEEVIDYLQLDIEPAKNTYECLLKIPFDKHKFRVITYEHDYYVDVSRSYREKSRTFLESKGYQLIVNDVSPDGKSSFEDWWVHPDLVSSDIIEKMSSIVHYTQKASDYILSSSPTP